jgi:hypothetical protein
MCNFSAGSPTLSGAGGLTRVLEQKFENCGWEKAAQLSFM